MASNPLATPHMAEAARGVLQILRGMPGATFKDVRFHCQARGDDMSLWPEWALCLGGFVTEEAGAMLIYEIMEKARGEINDKPLS